jgi:hypothetical protein
LVEYAIRNNSIAAPRSGVRPGIRVDAGNASSVDDNVCLEISGNTSAGSGGTQGIGLRKQGTVTTTNDFRVEGMAATSTPNIETYINSQNPAGSGTLLISATSGFSSCTTMATLPNNNQIVAQAQPEASSLVLEQAPSTDLNTVNAFAVASASVKVSEQASEINLPNTAVNASNTIGGGKPLFRGTRLVPALSGEAVGPITIGNLPAGKSVTIKYRVTVDNPVATSRILNQGTVTYTGAGGGVTTTDPSPNADAACSGTSPQHANRRKYQCRSSNVAGNFQRSDLQPDEQ